MAERDLRVALREFARDVFGSLDPDTMMGVTSVEVRRTGYNMIATAVVDRELPEGTWTVLPATGGHVARRKHFNQILRRALEVDPTLGGRWPLRVRVMQGDAVSVAARLDDAR